MILYIKSTFAQSHGWSLNTGYTLYMVSGWILLNMPLDVLFLKGTLNQDLKLQKLKTIWYELKKGAMEYCLKRSYAFKLKLISLATQSYDSLFRVINQHKTTSIIFCNSFAIVSY
ncbi:hypothetical protein KUTeg_013991 [Tegillarca granosa]|uniref:Uncharacterized protein n=1 Tax=Tegillarca granosa TaxID=220873 RepID=A0ABQ9EZS0_TEGGR|nr:hypothetical protein KUTeg_013991 [Tegillarca granosa]